MYHENNTQRQYKPGSGQLIQDTKLATRVGGMQLDERRDHYDNDHWK